jgi:hypothetical protein|eukprot:SAG25_NODE_3776_length_974_cov_0.710857_2_plen_100_part_00
MHVVIDVALRRREACEYAWLTPTYLVAQQLATAHRHVIIDHVRNIVDIQSTGCHVLHRTINTSVVAAAGAGASPWVHAMRDAVYCGDLLLLPAQEFGLT